MVCERPLATDIIIFRKGKILLIKRGNEPFKGMWALPGGRLEKNETLEECTMREGKEEIGTEIRIKKMTGLYSDPKRDPRRIVAVAYVCSMRGNPKPGTDAADARWFSIKEALRMKLSGDHVKIIKDALKALNH